MSIALNTEINSTFADLDKTISAFSNEQFNQIPFEGSWTAAQVSDHICKAISDASQLLNGPVKDAGRDPEKTIQPIRDLFLDFATKMKSPGFILPGDGPFTKESFLLNFERIKKEMLSTLPLDLSQLCLAAEMPGFGYLTRTEWLNFFLVHTQRHTHQLKNILDALNK